MHTYEKSRTPQLEEYFATARRHGIRVFIAPGSGQNNADPEKTVADVAPESTRPNIAAWYLADDTAAHVTPAALRRQNEAIHDVDPFHLTIAADSVASGRTGWSRYTDYVDATDVFSPEIYPFRKAETAGACIAIRDMKAIGAAQARAGRKTAIWPAIQAFDYDEGNPKGLDYYMPTPAEVRATTYLSLIHGATGVTFYTYGYGVNGALGHGVTAYPEFWKFIKGFATELSALGDVFTERTPEQTQRVEVLAGPKSDLLNYPSISTLLKKHEGKSYLFAANSSKEKVRASFAVPGAGRSVDVLSERRTIAVQDGAWQDEFEPLAVHVYVMP